VPENSIPMVGGEGPFGYITMGGMFSILKVRDGISSYEDPGWYRHPVGTVASAASAAELARDGIDATGPAGSADRTEVAEPDQPHHHH
jgi:manganese oxidase